MKGYNLEKWAEEKNFSLTCPWILAPHDNQMAHCSWQHYPDPLIPESKTRPLGTWPRLHRRAEEKCERQSWVNHLPKQDWENPELPSYLDWARIRLLLQSRSLGSKARFNYREMKLSLHAYHKRRHLSHIPHSFWASVSITMKRFSNAVHMITWESRWYADPFQGTDGSESGILHFWQAPSCC